MVRWGGKNICFHQMSIKDTLMQRQTCVCLAQSKKSSYPREAKLAFLGHSVLHDLVFCRAS
eukprot:979869-Amphidinium_carterae.2